MSTTASPSVAASTAAPPPPSVPSRPLNIPLIVSLGVVVPLFFLLVLGISFRAKLTAWLVAKKWARRASFLQGPTGTGPAGAGTPVMAQRPGTTGATNAGSSAGQNGQATDRDRRRRRRNPSIRTVPEYSADAGDTEIVLARSSIREDDDDESPSAAPHHHRRPSLVVEEDEERQGLLLTRTQSARTGLTRSSSEQTHHTSFGPSDPLHAGFSEVDLADPSPSAQPAAASNETTAPGEVRVQVDEPAEPPPGYESPISPTFTSIPLGTIAPGPPLTTVRTSDETTRRASIDGGSSPPLRGHRGSRSEGSGAFLGTSRFPRTETTSTTGSAESTSDARQASRGQQRSGHFRSFFQPFLPHASSSSSLLPTHYDGGRRRGSEGEGAAGGRGSPRPPSAFRIRHGRAGSTASISAHVDASSNPTPPGPIFSRPRASSTASQLSFTISPPIPDSFVASAYRYPASGPTADQMRFLGSVEEMSRLGVGPLGASRSSLALTRTRSASVSGPNGVGSGGQTGEGQGGAGGEGEVPPPPFEAVEGRRRSSTSGVEAGHGQHRATYAGPLLMPSYPPTASAASTPSPPATTGSPASTVST